MSLIYQSLEGYFSKSSIHKLVQHKINRHHHNCEIVILFLYFLRGGLPVVGGGGVCRVGVCRTASPAVVATDGVAVVGHPPNGLVLPLLQQLDQLLLALGQLLSLKTGLEEKK